MRQFATVHAAGCKEGGLHQSCTSVRLGHRGGVLQGSFLSRCWSSCPARAEALMRTQLWVGGEPSGSLAAQVLGVKTYLQPPCCRECQHFQEAPSPPAEMLVTSKLQGFLSCQWAFDDS